MRKFSIFLGVAVAILVATLVVYCLSFNAADDAAGTPAAGHSGPRKILRTDAGISRQARPARHSTHDMTNPDEELAVRHKRQPTETKSLLEEIARPPGENFLSTSVNAEIHPGETLVTGGYKTKDGNYELTLLTPRSMVLQDGSEAIQIQSKVLSVTAEFVESQGLGGVATDARNAQQHGEAWTMDDIAMMMTAASKSEGVDLATAPWIVTRDSKPITCAIEGAGGARFSIETAASKTPDGSFSILARVQKTEASGPDATPVQ